MIVPLTLTSMDHQSSNNKLHTPIYNDMHLQNHNELLGWKNKKTKHVHITYVKNLKIFFDHNIQINGLIVAYAYS